ncbi:MAG: hypothetical protein MRJ65_15395 [Candidatus Brocadiaceae bacterium]|nr:hypothetical protein [Candidatus Brocadiaceae bacterium]
MDNYITAITKPQKKNFIRDGVFQLGLFDQRLSELIDSDGTCYILRCNHLRAQEIQVLRESKYQTIVNLVEKNSLSSEAATC